MTISLLALLNRVVELQKTIPLVNSNNRTLAAGELQAFPYFLYANPSFPYFVNRIDGPDPIEDNSEDLEETTYDVVMRLVVDHISAGANHERELDLYAYIPTVKKFFAERRSLKDDTFTTELTGLLSADLRPGGTGFRIYTQSSVNAQQVGCEFTLRCRYEDDVEQVRY